jgi:hypothetical protein
MQRDGDAVRRDIDPLNQQPEDPRLRRIGRLRGSPVPTA